MSVFRRADKLTDVDGWLIVDLLPTSTTPSSALVMHRHPLIFNEYHSQRGCGGHIASVMGNIPEDKQCKCDHPGGPGAKPRKPSRAPEGKVDVHYKGPKE
ncbi:BQ2448_7881 [Microbotryum intermedium]|uniref:BQ2448_7881 protein n=1 Tax=Microbotryum intermedium TaxID=269621 RepID=A0A238FM69_9BASI|nr:BQ2448_7881 [Microbotryum intermedium]